MTESQKEAARLKRDQGKPKDGERVAESSSNKTGDPNREKRRYIKKS